MFGSWVLNEIWIIDLSPALIGMLMSSSTFSKKVHLNSGVRQLLELYFTVLKHVAFFTIWAKSTVAFTCTSLPLNLYTSVFGRGCGFGFEQKFWRIDGFGEKKARIGGFAYPYSPSSLCLVFDSCGSIKVNPGDKFCFQCVSKVAEFTSECKNKYSCR